MNKNFLALHILLMFYATGSIFSKLAANSDFMSTKYVFYYCMVLLILVIYAFFWQKILKTIPLNVAMANKAATVIWGMVFGVVFFNETINIFNIIGAVIIMLGIIIVVSSDKESE